MWRAMVLTAVFMVVLLSAAATYTAVRSSAIEAAYPATGDFVEVDGIKLHYVADGVARDDQPAIVVVHGASSNTRDLKLGLADTLSQHYRVITFDRPGFGWSERPDGRGALDPAEQAALLSHAVEKLEIGRHILVGHSWAGSLVLSYALDHPQKLDGVLALAPATHPWPGGVAWYYTVTAAPFVGELFARTLLLPLAELRMEGGTRSVFRPQTPPIDYVQLAGIPLILRPSSFRANAIDVAGLYEFVVRQSPKYSGIRVPLTVISGREDTTVWPTIHTAALEREVPGARVIVLDDVGHMPHYARPDLIKSEIDLLAAKN